MENKYFKATVFSVLAILIVPVLSMAQVNVSPLSYKTAEGGTAVFVSSVTDTNLIYEWQVNRGGGFDDIGISDSNYYRFPCEPKTKLYIKKTSRSMNGARYRCIVKDTVTGRYEISNETQLTLTGTIAQQKFQLTAALYSAPSGISDDNAANLTQTYIRCNVPIRKKDGININDSTFLSRWITFRNLFIQLTYSTNVGSLSYVNDSSKQSFSVTNPDKKYVNRLDLLQYAKFNLNFMSPIVTWIVPERRNAEGLYINDICHVYLDPYFSFITTSVADSPFNNINMLSIVYGANLTVRFTQIMGRLQFELNARMFGINPISGGINPNDNFQFARRMDYDVTGNGKPLTVSSVPYYNFDGLLMYNTSKSSDSSNNLFLHYSIFSNLVKTNFRQAKNAYYQLQIGYAADLEKLLTGLYATISK